MENSVENVLGPLATYLSAAEDRAKVAEANYARLITGLTGLIENLPSFGNDNEAETKSSKQMPQSGDVALIPSVPCSDSDLMNSLTIEWITAGKLHKLLNSRGIKIAEGTVYNRMRKLSAERPDEIESAQHPERWRLKPEFAPQKQTSARRSKPVARSRSKPGGALSTQHSDARAESESAFKLDVPIGANDNAVIEGENLHALAALSGLKFDLIYIDPPYNTGQKRTFRYSDRHDDWTTFMQDRLNLARSLMNDDATIFISIDDREHHRLRLVCDAVFGEKNFVASLVWRKSPTAKNAKKSGISVQHEYVLCYAFDIKKAHFNREKIDSAYISKAYRYTDAAGRFRTVPLHQENNKTSFSVASPSGKIWTKKWNFSEAGFSKLRRENLIYWGKNGDSCPQKKLYLKKEMSKVFGTMLPHEHVGYTADGGKALRALGFNGTEFIYAKPVSLLTYILKIASRPDSHILDFFAGSGTTGEAVMALNARDRGTRRFTLCNSDEDDICKTVTLPRVRRAKKSLNDQSTIKFARVVPASTILSGNPLGAVNDNDLTPMMLKSSKADAGAIIDHGVVSNELGSAAA